MLFIFIIFGILLFQLRVPDVPATLPPPSFLLEEDAQARAVFPIAQQEALSWQQDAQLSAVQTVWDDLGPGGIFKRDRWTFQFSSPSQQQMAIIRVRDKQARRLQTTLLPNRLPALPLEQWQVNSTQALQTWWERGGCDFVQKHPQVSISLKLRVEPGSTRPVWIITGSSSGSHWIVQLDSNDGTVLQ
jgi:hypothetical protein